MSSIIPHLLAQKLITPPSFLRNNIQYETMFGSHAYGTNTEDSDIDIICVAIPPKDYIFPHTAGYIAGFDTQYPSFDEFEASHIIDKSSGKEYDIKVYSIIKYFKLLYEGNPNIVDSIFVPENCIKHITQIGQLIRDNRQKFLSKNCLTKYRAYAASQMHKIESKKAEGKRRDIVEKYGYDTKFASHCLRLLDSAYMIVTQGDLIVNQNREEWKAIRRGEWTLERLKEEFSIRKVALEEKFQKSDLPELPDRNKIRELLTECLEIQYQDVGEIIAQPDSLKRALIEIDQILENKRGEIYK